MESGGSLSFQILDPWLLTLRPVSRKWQCFCKRSEFNITSSDHVPFLLRTFQMLPFLLTENLKTSPVLKALLTPSDPISSLTVRPSTLPFADSAPITPAPMLCPGTPGGFQPQGICTCRLLCLEASGFISMWLSPTTQILPSP